MASLPDFRGRAELFLMAYNYSGSGDWLDESGNGHNAQLGSTAGADSNDPLFKTPVNGEQFLYLPGSSGNYLSVPDHASLDITGDIDFRMKLSMTDWTPVTEMTLFGRMKADSGRSYRLGIQTGSTGKLILRTTPDGTWASRIESVSTVATGFTDGTTHWVRATLDVDNGASGNTVRFYTSDDGAAWTQLGADVVNAGTTSINAGTEALGVGALSTGAGDNVKGDLYQAQIYDGIAGTLVLDVDCTRRDLLTEPFSTFTDGTGNHTVTINRSASGVPSTVVDRSMFILDGVDDYLEIPDHANLDFAAGDSFTVVVLSRHSDVSSNEHTPVSKKDNHYVGTVGYSIHSYSTTVYGRFSDGSFLVSDDLAGAVSLLVANTIALRRDVVADEGESFFDGVSSGSPATDTTTGTLANAEPLRIGAKGGTASAFFRGDIMAVALFREALTDGEIAQLSTLLALTPEVDDGRGSHSLRTMRSHMGHKR